MREVGIAPIGRRRVPVGVQKPRVFLNRDLRCRHGKGVDPDAMNRPFHCLIRTGSHGEPAGSDVNLGWSADRHATTMLACSIGAQRMEFDWTQGALAEGLRL